MYVIISDLLDPERRALAIEAAAKADFESGQKSAGLFNRSVKNNLQIDAGSDDFQNLHMKLSEAVFTHPQFSHAVFPAKPPYVMVNRYDTGMNYGDHVDGATMGRMRADVSFTIFLSDPASYEGGELVMKSPMGVAKFKLPVGTAVIYPSSTLHHVEPVKSGSRLAVVGWAQSMIRDPAKRELLWDIDQAQMIMFKQHGKTPALDAISKAHMNLLRMWVET